jgi:hypothetical protein
MKRILFLLFGPVFSLLLFFSCESSILPPSYRVILPELPPQWREILGECRWRVEWVGPSGLKESADYAGPGPLELELLHAWPNPVLAWPCWPGKNLPGGMFRPAGALYPLDIRGRDIALSWEAGPEALFYLELEQAWTESPGAPELRRPHYFDWARLRNYLREEASPALRADPWLVNWKTAARGAVQSGFRTTLVKAEAGTAGSVIVPANGPWTGASPFAGPFPWTAGEVLNMDLKAGAEIFVSPGGIFMVSHEGQLWSPW